MIDDKVMVQKSKEIMNEQQYNSIYNWINDSVTIWSLNKLGLYTFRKGEFDFKIDTLLCFNSKGNRLITCIHSITEGSNGNSDGLIYFYGENINKNWYFFRGDAIVIPREMVKGHDVHKPLSYQQLHEIALKEVYGGYLNSKGEINEEWFTGHFENVGWCSKCKTSEEFRNAKLEGVRNNWASRDTTKPIMQLP